MVSVPSSNHTERLGLAELQRICAQASQIFREVSLHDVGIDAFIEIELDGAATGVLIGVQVKSGNSFVEAGGTRFRLPSDRKHLLYWSGCSFPVIGVIHEPSSARTAWIDITGQCTEERINSGPYNLTVEFTSDTELTAETLLGRAIPTSLVHLTTTLQQSNARDRVERCKNRWRSSLPAPRQPSSAADRRAAWEELLGFLLSPSASLGDTADAAHRLSFYLPPDHDERTRILEKALETCTDHQVRRLVGATDVALANDSYFAHSVAAIVARIPRISDRLRNMLGSNQIPSGQRETALQILEMIQQDEQREIG